MNFERIYQYRFHGVDDSKKKIVWTQVARFIHKILGNPERVLDPAAGKCEFINAIPSKERWAVDLNEYFIKRYAAPDIKLVVGNILTVELADNYFDAVFVSNFLEHLNSQEEVAHFLDKMNRCLKPGGRIVVMGPNYKYAYRSYFDFADHTVILSDLGVAEHLYGAGFEIEKKYGRFLPLSFRGGLPVNSFLVNTYLAIPFVWPFFGKQFLLVGRKL